MVLLAGLIVLLAVLQYRWLDQLSEREAESRDAARRVAQVNTRDLVERRLAQVMDELSAMAGGPELDLSGGGRDRLRSTVLARFTERLFWVSARPREEGTAVWMLDPAAGAASPAAWATLTDAAPIWVRTLVTGGPSELGETTGAGPLLFHPRSARSGASVRGGYLLAVLDPDALLEGIAELGSGPGTLRLDLRPVGRSGGLPASDAIPVAAGSRFSDQPVSGYWRLASSGPDSSAADPVASQRTRNLMLSGGVLFMLAATGSLLWVGARRARRIAAQRLEMVAGVSHELRTPLAVIHSAAANLADGVVTAGDHVAEYGELIRSESTRLRRLVDDALRLAGLAQQPRPGVGGGADLGNVLERAAGTAGLSALPDHGARAVRVDMEPMDLELVLTNVLGNAVRYGDDPAAVTVETRRTVGRLHLTVSNPAAEASQEEPERWFEPFHRGERARREHPDGSGMGLSIVRSIVERYGGRIRCQVAAGRVRVELDLPCPAAEERRG